MPSGDFGALRLTAEVFMARSGITVQVRNGGTVIGKQGSSLATCLCLLVFAPTQLLPKRVRIDVIEEGGRVQVQASLDDSFFLPSLSGLVAGRYRRQFDEWFEHLQGQVLPSDLPDEDIDLGALEVTAANLPSSNGHAEHGATQSVFRGEELSRQAAESEPGQPETLEAATVSDITGVASDPLNADVNLEEATVQPEAVAVPATSEPQSAKVAGEPTRGQEQASKKEPADKPASTKRGGFRLPRFGFGRRKRDAAVAEGGLPTEARRHAALAETAVEAKAWSKALTHYDAAVEALAGRQTEEGAEAIEVGRLFFKRGLAHFTQALSSFGSPTETVKSVSDHQIAIEMTRKAVADYSEAIRLDPGWSMAYYRRGEAHLFTARCERGSRSFRRASEELGEAIADLTRATERNPTFASAFAIRAVAHSLLDHEQESEADVEKAASLGTDMAALRKAIQASESWIR
ncbi:MAG TPA: hypothetical protein VFS30_01930 [Dehalococcoidia bacterium]|nr:hypothetical protein [Dehalococcoidia bacterium]